MRDLYMFLASFAQTWGLLLFVFGFLGVIAFAYWPSKKQQKSFDEAAQIPLKED
ncbi:MAG: cytochrome-c oxidase [Rhizobiales bacterium 32-66-8]|jgi:cytochrome c oxidase cbb3-type subunit 4|nr:MAG: cytochrome-c oxidase [Rhizobiales bacterium 32-66-8]